MSQIDIAINVFGKPIQTALTLLSLERESGHLINSVFFTEERPKLSLHNLNNVRKIKVFPLVKHASHAFILKKLGTRLHYFRPETFFFTRQIPPRKLTDQTFRHAIRYQYAWETSQTPLLFITHNDCYFKSDLLNRLREKSAGVLGVGEIGQCWNCPAKQATRCDHGQYQDYRPEMPELQELYCDYRSARPYLDPRYTDSIDGISWPLPECRLNEWAALINLDVAREITWPRGDIWPFGAYYHHLDIGVQWFRQACRAGFSFRHLPVQDDMEHIVGHDALLDSDRYIRNELYALDILQREFLSEIDGDPEAFFSTCYPREKSVSAFAARVSQPG